MARKLASIQKIKSLEPIEGADFIEMATVLGWHLVVKKGEFKVGDLCVYFEVDSFLPVIPAFEFLAKSGTKKMLYNGKDVIGYRLKTIRLRGQVSQGLALPISPLLHTKRFPAVWEEGEDVTEQLGVLKYEPPVPASLSGKVKGMFPTFIPKTDEIRLQALPELLERYKDQMFYATEKLDGSSCTAFWHHDEFNVCSRNLNLLEDEKNAYWRACNAIKLDEKMKEIGEIALQGEVVGEGIQGNKYKIRGQHIYFFNAYDFKNKKYLNITEFSKLAAKLDISLVPLVLGPHLLKNSVDKMVEFATRKTILQREGDIWAEGVVFRPIEEIFDPDIGRLSFKVINPEFLLKHGE